MAASKPNARTTPEAWSAKKLIEFVHKDVSDMKIAFDKVLKPFKAELTQARSLVESTQRDNAQLHADLFEVMNFLAKRHPESFDDALSLLLDRSRRGWPKFRASWRHRVGLDP